MGLRRRQFSRDFKVQVLREIEAGKTLAQAAREHQLSPNTITNLSASSPTWRWYSTPSVGASSAGSRIAASTPHSPSGRFRWRSPAVACNPA